MNHRAHLALFLVLLVGAATAAPARAEEITLDNGQKIVGTVVGFENGMFKVETEFGFALVRKDRVRSITFSPPPSKSGPAKQASDAGKAAPATSGASLSTSQPEVTAAVSAPVKSVTVVTPPQPPPPPVSRPLNEPLPDNIQEHLEGTNYINDTFQFAMYKPPGWKIHEGVSRETGRAIVAIGSQDERTLLFVDRQVWSGKPDLKSDAMQANLRRTYEDYQLLDQSTLQVDGRPAVRRDFTGVLDGAEWHGVSVHLARGNIAFGIIGLTSSELFQFQQAVLEKIIRSFHFRDGDGPSAAP